MQSLNQIAQYMLGLYVREREHNRFLVKHKLTFAWITREHNRVKINEIGGGKGYVWGGKKIIANQPLYTVSDESWLITTGNMQLYIKLQNWWGKTVHTFQKEISTLQLPDNSLRDFDRE